MAGMPRTITINRASVLTLWAAVAAERLGFELDEAVGRAVPAVHMPDGLRALEREVPANPRAWSAT